MLYILVGQEAAKVSEVKVGGRKKSARSAKPIHIEFAPKHNNCLTIEKPHNVLLPFFTTHLPLVEKREHLTSYIPNVHVDTKKYHFPTHKQYVNTT